MQPGAEVAPVGHRRGAAAAGRSPADAPERDRRLALARWIGDPANPLPARVMVNRVWHYHFGQGIVATPSDFGFNGGRPRIPSCSTGWPRGTSPGAGGSSRCTG